MTAEDLDNLARELGIPDRCRYVLLADGSGTTSDKPSGWCCFELDRGKNILRKHSGGWSGGTNNFAELSPFVHGLWAIHSQLGEVNEPVDVAIISDSEVTIKAGKGIYGRNANSCLWASINWFEQQAGYRLYWKWVPRNSNPFNTEADRTARQARLANTPKGDN